LIRKHIGSGKNIEECIVYSKLISNFAGEKKGTFNLVIHFSHSTLYYSTVHKAFSTTIIYIDMYPYIFYNALCFNTCFFNFSLGIVKRRNSVCFPREIKKE